MDLSIPLEQAHAQIDAGHFSQARAIINEALKQDRSNPAGLEMLGRSYLMEGNYAQAERTLRQALQYDGHNVAALNNLANTLFRQRKVREAIPYYKRALDLEHGQDARLLNNLANCYVDLNQLDAATGYFTKALKIEPDSAQTYFGLGRMYYEHDKLDLAESNIENAIHFKSDYASAYYYLGAILAKKGQYDTSITALRTSLQYEKDPHFMGETRSMMEQVEQLKNNAVNVASAAPPASPGPSFPPPSAPQTPPSTLLGGGEKPPVPHAAQPLSAGVSEDKEAAVEHSNQLLNTRQFAAAQREISGILSRFGDDPVLWNNLGYARAHSGDTKAAIDDYNRAIKLRKFYPNARYNLGQAYRRLGNSNAAEASFRAAIEDASKTQTMCAPAQNALGLMLKQRHDYEGARKAYNMAILQSGDRLAVAHYNLAIVLEKTDHARQAVHEYQLYIKLEPDGRNAHNARVRLNRLLGTDNG